MTRLLVLVEGDSEELFVQNILAPHLERFGVYARATGVVSKRLACGIKYTGGNRWPNVQLSLRPLLADTNAWVTTLLDFYGLPDNFPGVSAAYTGYQGNKSAMERACQEANDPENINHGKETHPSKRLEGYGMGFRKTSAVAVLKDIGLDAIRAACPHFNAWLDHLEKLGAPA